MERPREPGAATQQERRMSRRYPIDADVEIEWGSAVLRGRVRDLSATGMLIEVADPLWVGARFSAQLALEQPLRLDCVVRRIETGRGMAVTFVVSDEECRAQLAAFLQSLAKK